MTTTGYILITGAAKRIGRHLALSLAKAGHDIAVHFNGSHREAQSVVDEIKSMGRKAVAVRANLVDADQVAALIPETTKAMGAPVMAVVNNASLFEEDDIHSFTVEGWEAHMAVNTLAPLILSQAFAKALPEGLEGNIINIIDQRVWRPNPQFITYTASKAALYALTRTTAQALAPKIRVNAIGPGPVLESIHQTGDSFAKEAENVLLEKGPSMDEIADTVKFILATPSMTGQMIALDGGQHLAWQTPDIISDD